MNAVLLALNAKTLDPSRKSTDEAPNQVDYSSKVNAVPLAVVLGSEWCPRNASRELSWDAARMCRERRNHISVVLAMM